MHVTILGVRALDARKRVDAECIRPACEVTCLGPTSVLRQIEPWAEGTHVVEHEGSRHLWAVRREDGWVVDYTYHGPGEVGQATWEGAVAAEELVLEIDDVAADPTTARVLAWPLEAPPDPARSISRDLFPIGVPIERRGSTLVARIALPLPQLRHALVSSAGTGLGVGPRQESVAARIAARREELSLGLSAVAKSSGLAPMACRLIEKREREPRVSTLRALGLALDMSCAELLGPIEAEAMAADLDAYFEAVHGVVAASVEKRLVVHADGTAESTIETRRLRCLRGGTPLELRLSAARTALQRTPSILDDVEGDVNDARIRRVRRSAGDCEHELRFPSRAATGGVTYVRRFARSMQFAMTRPEAARRFPGVESYSAGSTITCHHPMNMLRLEVRFPKHFEPARIRGHCFSPGQVPRHDALSLASSPSPRVDISSEADGIIARLRIRAPLAGFQYGISWTLRPDGAPGD